MNPKSFNCSEKDGLLELRLDEWKKVDIDKLLSEYQFLRTSIPSISEQAVKHALVSQTTASTQQEQHDSESKKRNESISAAFSELEQMFQEYTPREVWWQRITSLQNWIELFFRKSDVVQVSSLASSSSFNTEISQLQRQVLVLRNELLYERVARQQLEYQLQHVKSCPNGNWELQANFEAITHKCKQQEVEVEQLKREIQVVRSSEKDARSRITTWDQQVQKSLVQSQEVQRRLQEENLNLKEMVDKLKQEMEQQKQELEQKSQRIYELETKVTENNSKLEKLKQSEFKVEHLQEEVLMWERSHAKWINTAKQNKQLSEGIIFRDKMIDAIMAKVSQTLDKQRRLTNDKIIMGETVAQMKRDSEKHVEEIHYFKQLLEQQQASAQEQIASVNKKYMFIKELNIQLQVWVSVLVTLTFFNNPSNNYWKWSKNFSFLQKLKSYELFSHITIEAICEEDQQPVSRQKRFKLPQKTRSQLS